MSRVWAVLAVALCAGSGLLSAAKPSFDCGAVREGSTEATICNDDELAALDVKLSGLYKKALETFPPDEVATLKATQRGWIKGRNESWKADDPKQFIKNEYETRIVQLQIQTGGVMVPSPTTWECSGGDFDGLTAYFYETDPPAATLTNPNGDQVIAILTRAASGSRYVADNVDFWNKGDEAMLEWFGQSLQCKLKSRGGAE